jgi:hypothetical protein
MGRLVCGSRRLVGRAHTALRCVAVLAHSDDHGVWVRVSRRQKEGICCARSGERLLYDVLRWAAAKCAVTQTQSTITCRGSTGVHGSDRRFGKLWT